MRLPWQARAELDREVAYHIETLADGFEAEGMSRAEALARARREFGGVEQVKDACRDESGWRWVMQIAQDLRFGWRMMRRSPAVSVAAVASLALGIGATTAILSFADAVLWRKMGVPHPEQMLEVFWEAKTWPRSLMQGTSGGAYKDGAVEVADFFSRNAFDAMRESAASKVDVAAHHYAQPVSTSFQGLVSVARLRGVSANFFRVLGVTPFAGRLPEQPGPVVVVTYGFWERSLQRRDGVIGESIRVNDYPYTIAGILPRSFTGITPGDRVELYTPLEYSPALLAADSWYRPRANDPVVWWLQLIGRRSAGVSVEEAQAVMNTAFAGSWASKPKTENEAPRIRLTDASTGLGSLRRQMGDPAWILLGLVSLVLLIACANIANLLLARGAQREKEVALRVSLGCAAGRLMRQFLTESLLIALLGGALGLVVAMNIGVLMRSVMPPSLDAEMVTLALDLRSLGAIAGVTLATALLFGLYPAWRASRVDAAPSLKEGTGSAGSMSRGRWLPAKMLVLAQVSLGVLLVMAAILYTGNLNEIVNRDAGFERGHVLLFDVRPGELGYESARLEGFYRNLEERLRGIPGVAEVGFSRIRPMNSGGYHDTFHVPGGETKVNSGVHPSTAGFLGALGVPLVAGRGLTAEDVRAGRAVAVVSEEFAQKLNVASPVGTRIVSGDKDAYEIVGVARNANYSRLTQPMPVLYIPLQKKTPSVTVLLRTHVPPVRVIESARQAVAGLDGNLPLVEIFTMEQQISRTLQRERMFAWLCGSFGVLALVLCVVGLYGLMSHTTARRTPEIGIRMALGASGGEVMRQVVVEGMRLASAGMVLGIPLALYAANLAQRLKMLPEGPIPYWTLAAAVGVLVVSAFGAVFGPALRAASVDPMKALRQG